MDFLAPDGPVYQAGTLSGNPVAMAAGLAQLKVLERGGVYEKLEEIGMAMEKMVRTELKDSEVEALFVRLGSMFCLFFQKSERGVRNLVDAQKSNTGAYGRFFHALLESGIYFPPSQYETCFLSCAHGATELELTQKAIRGAWRRKA